MFFTLLARSLTRGWKRKALVVVASAFGAVLVAAMLNISLDIGDKMNKELKSYGANLLVIPKMQALSVEINGATPNPIAGADFIEEDALLKIKTIFWRNNIVGFAPYLEAPAKLSRGEKVVVVGTWFNKRLVIPTGETVKTGIRLIKPWWKVKGKWPNDQGKEAMVGKNLAQRLNLGPDDKINLIFEDNKKTYGVRVVGLFESGDQDDDKVFLPLRAVQEGLRLPGKVGKIEVSALTTPENELARKAAANPDSLTPKEFEAWYCTAYVSSIAYQLEEVIPGAKAKPIRQVSESEGAILQKIQMLIWLLTTAVLVSSALGISSLMSTSVLERNEEIGLSKAIGANDSTIILLFLAEAAILGLMGGFLGYGVGVLLARIIGTSTFGTTISLKAFVLPVTTLLSVSIVWISSASAISTIIKLNPKEIIHGK